MGSLGHFCGAHAPLATNQRRSPAYNRFTHAPRGVVFTARVPKHVAGQKGCSSRSQLCVQASSGNGSLLPWQAAMDEVKKRQDLKSIMIIGAGPIVIGQVVHSPLLTTPVVSKPQATAQVANGSFTCRLASLTTQAPRRANPSGV